MKNDHNLLNQKRAPDTSVDNRNYIFFNLVKTQNHKHQNVSQNSNQNFVKSVPCKHSKCLPICKFKEDILNRISNNQVTIIAGETGCGKTTQVPQYLYYNHEARKEKVNILITQPRRIAAFSIAKRLSMEMKHSIGDLVGYHYGMAPVFSDRTQILIVTTGIFLQRLIHEKNLDEYTNLILDEVHERDMDIDFTLILVKQLLRYNNKIKLILMSATIATKLFANYFSRPSIMTESKEFYKNAVATSCVKQEV